MGGVWDWFRDDVLDIPDTPKQVSPYQGQDVTIHSTEAYLPIFKGIVKDVKPTVVAFVGVSGDDTDDDRENDLIHKIFVYGKKVQSIDAVRVDGVDSESTDWKDDEGNRWLHVRKFPNGMNSYDYELLNEAGYKGDYKFKECCCVYVMAEYGSEVVTSEPSDVRIDITGLPALPLDSASSSEQHYHNPVEHFYTWLTSDSSGPKWNHSVLDFASWVQAAKDCNIQIETYEGSGVYQSRYTFDYAIDTSQQTHEIIKIFLQAIRAHMPFDHSTGKYSLILEQDEDYATVEITDADIVDGINTSESADVGKKVNQVVVKYPDAEQNGKMVEAIYPPQGSTTDLLWLSEDNQQRKTKSIKLDSCNNYYLAMQQAKIEVENSREGLQAEFVAKPTVYTLKVGQIVPVTNVERGWEQKPFRIIGKTLYSDLYSELRLREHQPYIYDYHNTGLKPVIPDTNIDPNKLAKPTSLSITDSAYGGKKASWVSSYSQFDWQLESSVGVFINGGSVSGNTTELNNLIDGNTYVFFVRARNNIGKVSHWLKSENFTYNAPEITQTTPDNPLSLVIKLPDASLNTTPNVYVWKIYYSTIDHGNSPDTSIASYGGIVEYISGQTFTIFDAIPNTVYYVWFGLVKRNQVDTLPTQWTKNIFTSGAGIGIEHLGTTLAEFLAAIENLNIEDNLNTLQESLSENIDAINELNNITLPDLQEEIDDILPISATKISNNAITTNKIAANAVTTSKIAANAVTANEIAANTITANEIAANAVTANEIAANTITANEIISDIVLGNNATFKGTVAAGTVVGGIVMGATIQNTNATDEDRIIFDADTLKFIPANESKAAIELGKEYYGGPAIAIGHSTYQGRGLEVDCELAVFSTGSFKNRGSGNGIYAESYYGTGVYAVSLNSYAAEFYGNNNSISAAVKINSSSSVPPLEVNSSTMVDNLNAEMVGGYTAAQLLSGGGTNDIDTGSSGGYSWTDGQTGFTVKSGSTSLSGYQNKSVIYSDAFDDAWQGVVAVSGGTSTVRVTASNSSISFQNDSGNSVTARWIAVGETDV